MSGLVEERLLAEKPLVEGADHLAVHPTTMVAFGATGDLARRKLLPALSNLAHDGVLSDGIEMIVVARSEQWQTTGPESTATDFRRPLRPISSVKQINNGGMREHHPNWWQCPPRRGDEWWPRRGGRAWQPGRTSRARQGRAPG